VCGYEIKKMPIGNYLKTLDEIKEMPEDFLEECFPGESLDKIIEAFAEADTKSFVAAMVLVLTSAPAYVVKLIAQLTSIPEENLLNDPNIGLTGLAEIILAFLEVNDLGKFISVAGETVTKVKEMKITPTLTTGYKD
jgi:hypothetical protein